MATRKRDLHLDDVGANDDRYCDEEKGNVEKGLKERPLGLADC